MCSLWLLATAQMLFDFSSCFDHLINRGFRLNLPAKAFVLYKSSQPRSKLNNSSGSLKVLPLAAGSSKRLKEEDLKTQQSRQKTSVLLQINPGSRHNPAEQQAAKRRVSAAAGLPPLLSTLINKNKKWYLIVTPTPNFSYRLVASSRCGERTPLQEVFSSLSERCSSKHPFKGRRCVPLSDRSPVQTVRPSTAAIDSNTTLWWISMAANRGLGWMSSLLYLRPYRMFFFFYPVAVFLKNSH